MQIPTYRCISNSYSEAWPLKAEIDTTDKQNKITAVQNHKTLFGLRQHNTTQDEIYLPLTFYLSKAESVFIFRTFG